MGKISFISVLLVAAVIFISCSPIVHTDIPVPAPNKTEKDLEINAYGAYLAGRVAHIRKDFDQAADYYKLAYAKDPQIRKIAQGIIAEQESEVKLMQELLKKL